MNNEVIIQKTGEKLSTGISLTLFLDIEVAHKTTGFV